MELHVAFLPEEGEDLARRAVVVIDVLRATTSLLVLVERGVSEVVIAPSVTEARRYRTRHRTVLAAGEEGGRRPQGFDFGNSPAALARAHLLGTSVVLATTNGTRALLAVREAPVVLVGCLRNASAAARTVFAEASARGLDVTLVCAGREGRFGLDDAFTAGAMVDALCGGENEDLVLTDAALAARALFRAFPDPVEVFRMARAGQHIVEIGLEEDLPFCAERDRSTVVPRVGDQVRLLAE